MTFPDGSNGDVRLEADLKSSGREAVSTVQKLKDTMTHRCRYHTVYSTSKMYKFSFDFTLEPKFTSTHILYRYRLENSFKLK